MTGIICADIYNQRWASKKIFMLLKTSLNRVHRDLNARMVDFGGWDMPVIYTNQIAEHKAVREAAGLFDVSHMGELMIEGPDATKLVQKIFARDVSEMVDGQILLGVMCNENGGIIDDLTVYKFNDQGYLLVINAGTIQKDLDFCKKHAEGLDVEVKDYSAETSKIDIQGPKSEMILQKLTDQDLSEIKYFYFKEIEVAGMKMIVSRSGYTGEDGFEIYMSNNKAEKVWNALLEMGAQDGLIPCGLGSRDTLRTECGMMLNGHDIDPQHTPFEAVYGWTVSLNKDFVGKEALQKQKEEGVKRKLVGFEVLGRGIAREHYKIFHKGQEVGEVTSGTPAPTLGKNIGLGYVPFELREPGTELEIEVRGRMVEAKVVKMPFYKRNR
jgi:aminomethyltransferase